MGLPDQSLRESSLRIKSALRAQGFEFPKTHQILVNLRPNHLKKTSKGLELAVAIAFLLETQQIPDLDEYKQKLFFVYGELSLGGRVITPDDFETLIQKITESPLGFSEPGVNQCPPSVQILGGDSLLKHETRGDHLQLLSVAELGELKWGWSQAGFKQKTRLQRPPLNPEIYWSRQEAKLLTLLAAGGHSVLIAGASGGGKTTLTQSLHRVLPEPELNLHLAEGEWLPLVRPHHSIPLRAMIGGGSPPKPGELSRAQGGIFLMDEFLEFQSVVLESLRQPMEDYVIRVARGGYARELKCDTQFVATTNLCPCGNWVPDEAKPRCRFSLKRCRSYAERFSGPLLDRFEVHHLVQSNSKKERIVSEENIIEQVVTAVEFYRNERGQKLPNSRLSVMEIEDSMDPFLRKQGLPRQMGSVRREKATLRVARTLADMDRSECIENQHLREALTWTYANFSRLSNWD